MEHSYIQPHVPGQARFMRTNHGEHPPEFWAQVTAEHIAPINPEMTGPRRFAAMQLQARIADALLPHHTKVQDDEHAKLTKDPVHHTKPVDPSAYIADALAAITKAAKGTEWQDHLNLTQTKPAWLDDWRAKVDALGLENVPLSADQQKQLDGWDRQQLVVREIATHFATAQHIAKSWHRDRLRAAQ